MTWQRELTFWASSGCLAAEAVNGVRSGPDGTQGALGCAGHMSNVGWYTCVR